MGVLLGTFLLMSATFVVLSGTARTPQPNHSTDTTQLAATCSLDTGGTCYLGSSCYPWRKDATCSWGKCVCPQGMCAHQGTCLPPDEIPLAAPPPPTCEIQTGGTCRFSGCDSWRNAHCSGAYLGFSSGISLGECVCAAGKCAVDGKCVESTALTAPPAKLNANYIVCPVLAALYNAGFLVPDAYGRVERLKVQAAIVDGLGGLPSTGWFFGQTTAGYTEADVDSTDFMMTPIEYSMALLKDHPTQTMETNSSLNRYLNIFTMGSNTDVLHGIAAAVRGGEGLVDKECTAYPCPARFTEFFAKFAEPNGRIYSKNLGEIACNIYSNGFHGVAADTSLFSLAVGLTGREFLALSALLPVFGQPDEAGNQYFNLEDWRIMEMNGVFPPGWVAVNKAWNVLDIQNEWRLQGVCGVSDTFKTVTLLTALQEGTNTAITAAVHDETKP